MNTPAPRHITQAAEALLCHVCGATIAWRFPSGYVRFETRELKRETDGRLALICSGCGKTIKLAA